MSDFLRYALIFGAGMVAGSALRILETWIKVCP